LLKFLTLPVDGRIREWAETCDIILSSKNCSDLKDVSNEKHLWQEALSNKRNKLWDALTGEELEIRVKVSFKLQAH
jgi:hypothetical protein